MKTLAILLTAILLPGLATAADAYKCTVQRFAAASKDDAHWAAGIVGTDFVVARNTGVIVGGILNNSMGARPIVVDHGSPESAFKVVTMSGPLIDQKGPGSYVQLLEVEEQVGGMTKPFMFVDTYEGGAYFGTCVYF